MIETSPTERLRFLKVQYDSGEMGLIKYVNLGLPVAAERMDEVRRNLGQPEIIALTLNQVLSSAETSQSLAQGAQGGEPIGSRHLKISQKTIQAKVINTINSYMGPGYAPETLTRHMVGGARDLGGLDVTSVRNRWFSFQNDLSVTGLPERVQALIYLDFLRTCTATLTRDTSAILLNPDKPASQIELGKEDKLLRHRVMPLKYHEGFMIHASEKINVVAGEIYGNESEETMMLWRIVALIKTPHLQWAGRVRRPIFESLRDQDLGKTRSLLTKLLEEYPNILPEKARRQLSGEANFDYLISD